MQQPPPKTDIAASREVRLVSATVPEPPEGIQPPTGTGIVASQELRESLGLPDLLRISLERNPELRRAGLQVEAAQGRAVQAGLYPNPTVSTEGTELGNRNGPGGFIVAPFVGQELVTGGKLRLGRAVAEREVNEASLGVTSQRFTLFTTVRRGYFEVLAAQRRTEIFSDLVGLATKATETTDTLVKARQAAPLDLIQMRVELNRFRAELEAAHRDRTAAWRRLAAAIGAPELPDTIVRGELDAAWPNYDFDLASRRLLDCHPDIRAARIAVSRAQLAVDRARAERIPNVTVGAGYERDNVDNQDQWAFRASMPIPVFNRNQGNVQAASAEVGRSMADVARVQNKLLSRLATAFGQYAAARERTEAYRKSVLPDATEAYQLALAAFKGGQFEYLRVLQAQRAVAEANLEYVRALTDLWQAASDMAGLLLEEDWPTS
jgi:cobalt-zinc-cadmium efflux system outer membrane protein